MASRDNKSNWVYCEQLWVYAALDLYRNRKTNNPLRTLNCVLCVAVFCVHELDIVKGVLPLLDWWDLHCQIETQTYFFVVYRWLRTDEPSASAGIKRCLVVHLKTVIRRLSFFLTGFHWWIILTSWIYHFNAFCRAVCLLLSVINSCVHLTLVRECR